MSKAASAVGYANLELIRQILQDIDEEDRAICLFSSMYQSPGELCFFRPPDRERVAGILRQLTEESKRHKEMLEMILARLDGA